MYLEGRNALLFTALLGLWASYLLARHFIRLDRRTDGENRSDTASFREITLRKHRIFVIGGIGGEILASRLVGHYMLAMEYAFMRLFPRGTFKVLQPTLFRTTGQSALDLACEIFDAPDWTAPVVLYGHSKGGLDILEMMIHFPATIPRVQLAVLSNSPLQGSWTADLLVNRFLRPFRIRWTALEELTTEHRTRFWKETWSAVPEWQRRLIAKRLHVVTTEEFHSLRAAWPIVLSHWLMRRSGHRSDGLVTIEGQALPSLPEFRTTPTSHFFHHHGFATCSSTLSNASERERIECFTQVFASLRESAQVGARTIRHLEVIR